MNRVLSEYGMQKADDLFAAIGYGKLPARSGAGKVRPVRSS